MEVLTDDPKLRREAKSYATFVDGDIVVGLEEIISSGSRLKRVIGLVLCFKKKLLDCIRGNRSVKKLNHIKQHSVPLDLEGIKMVEKENDQICPEKTFWRRINILGKRKMLEVM